MLGKFFYVDFFFRLHFLVNIFVLFPLFRFFFNFFDTDNKQISRNEKIKKINKASRTMSSNAWNRLTDLAIKDQIITKNILFTRDVSKKRQGKAGSLGI